MSECIECTKNIPDGERLSCPNCNKTFCSSCANNTKNICPNCYHNLEISG